MHAPLFALASALLAQGPTETVSVTPSGMVGNGGSQRPALSADGRFVAFESVANDLGPNDPDQQLDIFVRDRSTGITELVSTSTFGGGSHKRWCFEAQISSDGRFVAFSSQAAHLVPVDDNGKMDVFVRDRASGIMEIASVATNGDASNGDSYGATISDDGRFVAFHSQASNLGPGSVLPHVYLRDRASGTTTLIDALPDGSPPWGTSAWPRLSRDGRFVAFQTYFGFVPQDTDQIEDVYLRDLSTGTIELVSVSMSGVKGNDTSRGVAISDDGRFVAFSSLSTNLVSNDHNGPGAIGCDIFVRDRVSGWTMRASEGAHGEDPNAASFDAALSGDGRTLLFSSYATNLGAPLGGISRQKLFWKDLVTGELQWQSPTYNGSAQHSDIESFALSSDGRVSAFGTSDDFIVPLDFNGASDVFVRSLPALSIATYCTAKTNTLGCVPALTWTGAPSASAGQLAVAAQSLLNNKLGLFFWGRSYRPITAFGLCVSPPFVRAAPSSSGGSPTGQDCTGSIAFTWTPSYMAAVGAQPGDTIYTQCWSRDPGDPSGASTTQGLRFVILP